MTRRPQRFQFGVIAEDGSNKFSGFALHNMWISRTKTIQAILGGLSTRKLVLIFVGLASVVALALELRSSWLQSHALAAIASRMTFSQGAGRSDAIYYPHTGPYDHRLGYAELPDFLQRAESAEYTVRSQTRSSKLYLQTTALGLYPIYQEKSQAGLRIEDRDGNILEEVRHPVRGYSALTDVPPTVVNTLLFIENRSLLNSRHPHGNPAIEWRRMAYALMSYGKHEVDSGRPPAGGSTLATQLEKMRHSPQGRTGTAVDKVRQLLSASLRAYQNGPETLDARRRIVRDYLNSIPLAASRDHGEVIGLGDGLWVWYEADFTVVNRLLMDSEHDLDTEQRQRQARAYREVLSLLLATRAPHRYLVKDPQGLASQTDRYLRLLCSAGVISESLRDLALHEHLLPKPAKTSDRVADFVNNKARDTVRTALRPLLGLGEMYALDRLDLSVRTTFDATAQQNVTQFLRQLAEPQHAATAKLYGAHLLSADDLTPMIYSFTLYERSEGANLLRVQTDSYNQPLSINQGTKLELGSTAKLRTLICYLQIVETLHTEYAGFAASQLRAARPQPEDPITRWAVAYLSGSQDRGLPAMLDAALNRRYSANPGEGFFTAGGSHRFANFDSSDDDRIFSVREAFRNSVNLVFIRLMRDIERYYLGRVPGASSDVVADSKHEARQRYLSRFADYEGRVFLARFYRKYGGQTPEQALETLARSVSPATRRVAVIHRSVCPDADFDQFLAFMRSILPLSVLTEKDAMTLYEQFAPDKFDLSDRGHLARVHPLELWLLYYLHRHPQAPVAEVFEHSASQRQEVYRWLFRTGNEHAQNQRIRVLLEQDTFKEIERAWKRVGYPFDSLVPSYATAIGVSGDTPVALAELMGIIVNDGIRYPSVAVQELHFAPNTPFETLLDRQPNQGERVLSAEIAALVRQELIGVVAEGTGRRIGGGITLANGTVIPVGGKTGTGDNRSRVFASSGRFIESRAGSRTAAFVFMIGNRFFGTVMIFVPGSRAADYHFTSALALQIFKGLQPEIQRLLERANPDSAFGTGTSLLQITNRHQSELPDEFTHRPSLRAKETDRADSIREAD